MKIEGFVKILCESCNDEVEVESYLAQSIRFCTDCYRTIEIEEEEGILLGRGT